MDQTHAKRRTGTRGQTGPGRLLEALVLQIFDAFFDLRAVGQKQGLVNQSGAGNWGLLRILKEDGSMTVPAVARMRSVSRQYIQKLRQRTAEGLIEMVDNPAHKRSKLMRLTQCGEQRLEELTRRFRAFLEVMARDFHSDDLRSATDTIAELRRRLARTG